MHYYTPARFTTSKEEFASVHLYDSLLSGFYEDPQVYFDTSVLEKTFKGFEPFRYEYRHSFPYQYIPMNIYQFTEPEFNARDKTVKYYESLTKKERGIKTESKIGKYLKKVVPFYNDKQIEYLVNIIVEEFMEPTYTFHQGQGSETFKEIYTSSVERGGDIGSYSCINASCMRYTGWETDTHPVEIYGTDDFKLCWLQTEDGKIAARTIVCTLDNAYADIYVSNKKAGDILRKHLEEIGAKDYGEFPCPWQGARLLKITEDDMIVSPFMDIGSDVKEFEDCFKVSYNSYDYSFSSADGYTIKKICCPNCGDRTRFLETTNTGFEGCSNCLNYCQEIGYTELEVVKVYDSNLSWDYSVYNEEYAKKHFEYDEVTERYCNKYYYTILMNERKAA